MMKNETNKRLFTLKESAEYLGLKVSGVRSLINSSALKAIDLTGQKGKYLIDKSDLDKLIDSSKADG